MIDELLAGFNDQYELKRIENDEYSSFKMSGLNFDTGSYEAKGLGHISIMRATGLLGAMNMESFIVNPYDVDMPLLSVERIKAMGKDSLYMEIYDTCLSGNREEGPYEKVADKYKDLEDIKREPKWYDDVRYASSIIKKVSNKESSLIDDCIRDYVQAYLKQFKEAVKCDAALKKAKTGEYLDGLLNNGGPAVDTFLRSWGKEKTEDFFNKVLFG